MTLQARHESNVFYIKASERKDAKKNSKPEIIEISDESTNPRCRFQGWQHFGFKVTYNCNGLRFKSSTEVICQVSFHRKQKQMTNKSDEVCYYLSIHMI